MQIHTQRMGRIFQSAIGEEYKQTSLSNVTIYSAGTEKGREKPMLINVARRLSVRSTRLNLSQQAPCEGVRVCTRAVHLHACLHV